MAKLTGYSQIPILWCTIRLPRWLGDHSGFNAYSFACSVDVLVNVTLSPVSCVNVSMLTLNGFSIGGRWDQEEAYLQEVHLQRCGPGPAPGHVLVSIPFASLMQRVICHPVERSGPAMVQWLSTGLIESKVDSTYSFCSEMFITRGLVFDYDLSRIKHK